MPPPVPTPIYHITHLRNLPGIVTNSGLFCCAALRQHNIQYKDIANEDIQDKRTHTPVPCGPGGNLHDYVPLYFAPRSPMLYVISRGGPRYPEGQVPVVHLVSSAQAVYGNRPAVFTNGHAIMTLTDYFDDLEYLDQIDWEVMASRFWNDTQQYPDRKRRRQAEFLVHYVLPWTLVEEIGVINRRIAAEVEATLQRSAHRPLVQVRPEWYY